MWECLTECNWIRIQLQAFVKTVFNIRSHKAVPGIGQMWNYQPDLKFSRLRNSIKISRVINRVRWLNDERRVHRLTIWSPEKILSNYQLLRNIFVQEVETLWTDCQEELSGFNLHLHMLLLMLVHYIVRMILSFSIDSTEQ